MSSNERYDKEAYRQSALRKNQYLGMLNDFWRKTQTDAVLLQTTGKEKILQETQIFKFRVVPTIQRKNGTWGITNWIPYDEWLKNGGLQKIDYYSILPNEIVIESDYVVRNKDNTVNQDKTWNDLSTGQKTVGDKIRKTLTLHHIPRHIGFSGGKGPHTSIYFSLPEQETITRMEKKHIILRDLRLFLFHKILDMAGIPSEQRTRHGGVIDTSCVDWNGITGRGHLVRCYGGRKFGGIEDKEMIGYKTLFTDGIPDQKPIILNFTQVTYPQKIQVWKVPPELINMFIDSFKPSTPTASKNIVIKGKHINLPCIRLIRHTPVFSGSRNEMCRQLAYACILDKKPFEEALSVCDEFYNNADKQDFDYSEAKYIFGWAYRQNTQTYIACPIIKKYGFCNDQIKQNCELYRMKRKEFIDQQNKKQKRKTGYHIRGYSRQPEQLKPYSRPVAEWMRKKTKMGE